MSTVAEAPRRRRPAAGPAKRASGKPLAGLGWIAAIAALLAGVVAIQVLVIQLNMEHDRLGSEKAELRADIARLRSQMSSAASTARIERVARDRIGLVEADPSLTTYVRLKPEGM